MVKLNWDGNDFRNSQDSSSTVADNISRKGNLQQGYNHGSLTRGLIACYPMEKGEGEVLHDGAMDNLGQINSASWSGDSIVGNNSLEFSGGSYADIGFTATEYSPITITGWVKFDTIGNDEQPMVAAQDETPDYIWLRANPDGTFSFGTRDTSNHWASTSSTGQTDKWYFLAGLFRPKKGYEIYVYDTDGLVEHSSSSDTTYVYVNANTHIGNRNNNSQTLNGSVEDIRIYSRALSEPEIEALASVSQPSGVEKSEDDVPGQSEGGITRYKLNGDVTDSWGDNNGTNNGADLTATGVYGQAAKFDGSSGVSIDNDSSLEAAEITASAWFVHNNYSGNWDRIIHKGNGDVGYGISETGTAGQIDVHYDDGTEKVARVGKTLESGNWYHIAMTWNGSSLKVYLNGEDATTEADTSNWNEGNAQLRIGERAGGSKNYWNGKIDDVRIYNKALRPLQVEKLYHKGAYRIPRESTLQ